MGYFEVAHCRRSKSSIWHMLYRLGGNTVDKDSFTKYTLAVALHVDRQRIEGWIARGWLKAREVQCGKMKRVIIQAEDFCDFCRKPTGDVVGNRLSKESWILCAISHFLPATLNCFLLAKARRNGRRITSRSKMSPKGSRKDFLLIEPTKRTTILRNLHNQQPTVDDS